MKRNVSTPKNPDKVKSTWVPKPKKAVASKKDGGILKPAEEQKSLSVKATPTVILDLKTVTPALSQTTERKVLVLERKLPDLAPTTDALLAFTVFKEKLTQAAVESKHIADSQPPLFFRFLNTILELMELDIYLSPLVEKEALLATVPDIIARFFTLHPNDVRLIVEVLRILTQDSRVLYYDRGWLHEERHALFDKSIEKLNDLLLILLTKTTQDTQRISPQEIATVLFAMVAWQVSPKAELMEALVQEMEAQCYNHMPTAAVAFQCLCGIVEFSGVVKKTPARKDLFARLATQALPLLLADEEPLRMFPANNLALSRIAHLKNLLPEPDSALYQYHSRLALQKLLRAQSNEWVAMDDIEDTFPPEVIPYRALQHALNAREAALLSVTFDEKVSEARYGPSSYKKDNVTFFSAHTYLKYLRELSQDNNPKGLQWYVTRYSAAITSHLSGGYVTYPLEDISRYLKILRKCVLDMASPEIRAVIKNLCAEALLPLHFKEITADVVIDLLWINMVLATTAESEDIAYSKQDQSKLFEKIQKHTINADQARALWQIRAMRWHGNILFSPPLLMQMQVHREKFSEGVNPSEDEKAYFTRLKSCLSKKKQRFLHANYICEETGQEIDIAYVEKSKPKIAVHIDGPAHFDPVTGKRTLKTQFRNQCLQATKWRSMDVNLTTKPDPKQVVAEFQHLRTQPLATQAPSSTQQRMTHDTSSELKALPSVFSLSVTQLTSSSRTLLAMTLTPCREQKEKSSRVSTNVSNEEGRDKTVAFFSQRPRAHSWPSFFYVPSSKPTSVDTKPMLKLDIN